MSSPGLDGGPTPAASDYEERLSRLADDWGVTPAALPLLRQALTHRSLMESSATIDNERLEFLGDSVLGMLVSEHLFGQHPEQTEGELTRGRARLVSRPALAHAARRLQLGELLRLSLGEEQSGGRDRDSTLSDAFEALLAAVFLSEGIDAARKFVNDHLIASGAERGPSDFKSRLQELLQGARGVTPTYRIVGQSGPPHQRRFAVEVLAEEAVLGEGNGPSKKTAEQRAAQMALERLAAAGAGASDAH